MTKTADTKRIAAALIAGLLIGSAAFCLKRLIAVVSQAATVGFHAESTNLWLILAGVCAIVVSGLLVRKVVRQPIEHATAHMKNDLAEGRAPLPRKIIFAPILLNTLTLGLGGSAGAEGPIAYSGAAIASRLARVWKFDKSDLLLFMACGAGAGIAAIFKAPVGGMFFAIEVLGFTMSTAGLIILTTMCLTAGMTAYALGGFTPNVIFSTWQPLDLKWYVPALLLGLWCGLYSRYYSTSGRWTADSLGAIKKPLLRNLVAGLILGASLFMFPALYGEGYGVLADVLNGSYHTLIAGTFARGLSDTTAIVTVLCGIILVKSFATYATNSGGGVAGDFAPTIFAGGMAGALFAIVVSAIPGWEALPAGDFVLLAMAGVMAGVIKAPLMAIFIVIEMTQRPELLLPVALVSLISFAAVKIQKFSIFKT